MNVQIKYIACFHAKIYKDLLSILHQFREKTLCPIYTNNVYQNLKINDEFMDKLTLSDYLNDLYQCKDVTVTPFIESIGLIKKYIIITSI